MKHVHIVTKNNSCYDIGTMGHILKEIYQKGASQYSKIVLLNSSVRGPFYHERSVLHWAEIFFSHLDDKVKLVGPTINCESFPKHPGFPHVQSYCLAMDNIGLDILMNSSTLDCFRGREATIRNSEIGASRAVLEAGYEISSLQPKYQVMESSTIVQV